MREQAIVLFTAIMYFTRIPCPGWVGHSEEYLNRAIIYFPFIGWIVGSFAALVYWSMLFVFPPSVAIILSMISSILLTGAFHEDGFADVCDGFGGGWTKAKILEIMKDSRIGAYGVIGLILILGLKFSLLYNIKPELLPFALIAAHSLSRFVVTSVIFTHSYVRENEDSKAKQLAKKITVLQLIVAGLFGILPLLLLKNIFFFLIILPVFIVRLYLTGYFTKWIGGYTGDCLGTVQQVTEITFYIFFIILWKFI